MPSLVANRVTLVISATGIALFGLLWNSCSQCLSACPSHDGDPSRSGYLEFDCAKKPHQSSWGSWFHPDWIWHRETRSSLQQQAGALTRDWNILYHLGGVGPWVEKTVDVVEGGIAVPEGCEVEQVHMMARHGERYPTKSVGRRIKALFERMKSSGISFKDDLAFFNDWDLFWTDDSQIEQLTSTGPFSGRLGAFTTGVRLRTRYQRLLSIAESHSPPIKYWASGSPRVIETARYFGAGFFGLDLLNKTNLEVISEDSSRGADTLTPGDTCRAYYHDPDEGHDYGYTALYQFRATYLGAIRERLLEQNPDIEFSDEEIYAMQEMCGFETTVRGSSRWCHVFTQDEFLSFEYARDVLHYYRAGPGTKWGAVMGWLWLNATVNLMLEGPSAGPLYFSFVHDGDIAPMITALDIITDPKHLPTTRVQHDRKWRKSQVSPMGGRTIFELLSCGHKDETGPAKYVRININDGITAIPGCESGPGSSCPLKDFVTRTKEKGEEAGDFREKCGLSEEAADRITFLHQ
ncbi:phosphoglycerate mutase-like protein [Lentithecium fluviatile CBS 122367]|uniref:3-phytase n=1 Tax=Lentithecium fluviatile CBS 122367 TaxID=1168545 RepID=A0A6G1JHG0_9PLEO|nr:phosphoglycerate mutase-like protein [Lentithecium fluviatile CBS 122367]